jgi:type VI secretion system protein ImpJ
MAKMHEVNWHEGLFLQPHHLQWQQRALLERLTLERRFAWSYPYGLVESRLSGDALENLQVKFDRLLAVMPSGTVVSVPENADMPVLDIKTAFESGDPCFTVFLGVPLWAAQRANLVGSREEERQAKRLYRSRMVDCHDENTGENVQPVSVREVNARLLLKGDDASDLETLPVLRITHAVGERVGLPRQDPRFMPPCLTLTGSSLLRELVRDLTNQVEASRRELILQIRQGGFQIQNLKGIQFEQVLRLRTLSHFGGRLQGLAEVSGGGTPFDAYVELRSLLGELAALHPDRDLTDVPKYDHDDPAPAFLELNTNIRALLQGAVKRSVYKVDFEAAGNVLMASLKDEHIKDPNEYYLGIETRQDPRALAQLVEDADKFKLMPKSLTGRPVYGIRLAFERMPSLDLPAKTGLHYFRLLRSESARTWERVLEDRALTAEWPNMAASDLKLTLYMTVPTVGAAK